jgi:hypothetical protein
MEVRMRGILCAFLGVAATGCFSFLPPIPGGGESGSDRADNIGGKIFGTGTWRSDKWDTLIDVDKSIMGEFENNKLFWSAGNQVGRKVSAPKTGTFTFSIRIKDKDVPNALTYLAFQVGEKNSPYDENVDFMGGKGIVVHDRWPDSSVNIAWEHYAVDHGKCIYSLYVSHPNAKDEQGIRDLTAQALAAVHGANGAVPDPPACR